MAPPWGALFRPAVAGAPPSFPLDLIWTIQSRSYGRKRRIPLRPAVFLKSLWRIRIASTPSFSYKKERKNIIK
jgi:hypothetical protein